LSTRKRGAPSPAIPTNGEGNTTDTAAVPAVTERYEPDLVDIIRWKVQNGLNWVEISRMTGIPRTTLRERFQAVVTMLDPKRLEEYRGSRIQILTGIEAELLRHLADPDRLKKASINNLAYAFYQINNARRLEEGRSTQNLDMRQVIAQLDSEGARIRQLLERITYHDEKETQ